MGALKLSNLLHDISLAVQEFDLDYDCFAKGQLESKEWAVDLIKDLQSYKPFSLGTVFVLCGWYGILPAMMFSSGMWLDKIRSFDIDDKCWKIADRINRTSVSDGWKFKAATEDIFRIRFSGHMYKLWSYAKKTDFVVSDIPDTIINTSCEHTKPSWFKYIPRQKLVVLQSNNFWDGEGHINCVNDLDEFKQMFPLKDILYEGKLNLEKYTRFMLIGTT
jgi:hypothetical protein